MSNKPNLEDNFRHFKNEKYSFVLCLVREARYALEAVAASKLAPILIAVILVG